MYIKTSSKRCQNPYEAFHLQVKIKLYLLRYAKILVKDSVYKLKINTSFPGMPKSF